MGIKMNYGKTRRKTELYYLYRRCEMKFFGSAVYKNNLQRQTEAVAKNYSSDLFPKTFLLSHPTSRIFLVSQKNDFAYFCRNKSRSAKQCRLIVLLKQKTINNHSTVKQGHPTCSLYSVYRRNRDVGDAIPYNVYRQVGDICRRPMVAPTV